MQRSHSLFAMSREKNCLLFQTRPLMPSDTLALVCMVFARLEGKNVPVYEAPDPRLARAGSAFVCELPYLSSQQRSWRIAGIRKRLLT